MKALLSLLAVLTFTTISQAEVKPPGTFVPSQCGKVQYAPGTSMRNPIYKLCLGTITAGFGVEAKQALSLTRPIGKQEILTILKITPKEVMFGNGELLTYTVRNQRGEKFNFQVSIVNNELLSIHGIDLGLNFVAHEFEFVMTTM